MKKIILFLLLFIYSGIAFGITMNESALREIKRHPDKDNASFIILGDSRNSDSIPEGKFGKGDSILIKIVRSINKISDKPEFVIHSGDLGIRGYKYEYFRYRSIIDSSKIPWLSIRGNHELYSDSATYYFNEIIGDSDYVFDWNKLRFIMLSNCHQKHMKGKNYSDYFISKHQLIWLDSIMKDAKNRGIIPLMFAHVPPCIDTLYTNHCLGDAKSYPKPNIEKSNVKPFKQLLRFYNVPLAVFGHIHHYDNFMYKGTRFVISGGAGAPMYKKFKRGDAFYHYILMEKYGSDSIKATVLNEDGVEVDKKYNFTVKINTKLESVSLKYNREIKNDTLTLIFENPLVRYISLKRFLGKAYYCDTIIKKIVKIPVKKWHYYQYKITTGNSIQKGSFFYH